MELPKYNKSQEIGEIGLSIVKKTVESQLNWIFRKNHQEHDFGIDAFIDIIAEKGQVTGKSIAVQIKTGKSYFDEPTSLGWIYRGQMSHLNYYLNHEIPVIILIVDNIQEEIFWCLCDADKTDKAGDSWKILIPKKQRLTKESKAELIEYINPTIDYVSQLEHLWQGNKMLKKHERILLVVAKEEILELNFENLILAFDRFENSSEELIVHLKNKIDVLIDGYNDDPREIDQIPEVMLWTREVFKVIDSWSYFLTLDKISQFIKVLHIAHSKYERIGPNIIEYDTKSLTPYIKALFDKLNKFCDKHGISDDVNIEISKKIFAQLNDGGIYTSDNE